MKKLILIVAFFSLSIAGFAQTNSSETANTELVSTKKVEELATRKVRTIKKAKYLKVNYKKSNDIISIKAYRKSLKDKVRRESRLC
ncbi:MAG: hypothetical protein ED556_04360 [Winogradskyella sp.]|uniref:hypothetical protein n=1 Tax=Winogradskyella sp. TaxID=1883156 RepID=UPI000F41D249|nr:hypothetical protein [Winogradskyella sp.]RNC88425.1 MAG: hypothetical protein ED556_04360 [Winogradskyella sp.]